MKAQRTFIRFTSVRIILISLFVFVIFQNVNFAQDSKGVQNKENESQDDIILINTNLITVPTTVLDRSGRYITNLRKEDFQIFEDGVEQEIEFFDSVDEPFTIFFLIYR